MLSPSCSRRYEVFVSHAGEDKATIAIPLRNMLRERGITTFVDEKDIRSGVSATSEMTAAMKNADVAVIVLSPEYVAKKWPIKELVFFLNKREQALAKRHSLPYIVPVFYRLSIPDMYKEPRFERKDDNGKSLYHKTRFFERMNNGEPEANVDIIRDALRSLHDMMGVENKYHASNELSSAPSRSLLLQAICDKVSKTIGEHITRISADGSKQGGSNTSDEFRRNFPDEVLRDVVLDFESMDARNIPLTIEGRIKNRVLYCKDESQNIVAVVGGAGVGKSTILKGLATDEDMWRQYCDGVHLLLLGMDATIISLFEELCLVLYNSGAVNTEARLRKKIQERLRIEKDVDVVMREGIREALRAAMSWFRNRSCAFLIDDVWTSNINEQMLSKLFKLGGASQGSIVVFTTRERDIAAAAPHSSIFTLTPREVQGTESRKILLCHAGLSKKSGNIHLEPGSITDVLEICSGLPVTLAVVGKGVKMLAVNMGAHEGDPWSEYLSIYKYREQLLRENAGEYGNLDLTFRASIGLLEGRKKEKLAFETPLSFDEMYRRLWVLQKRSKVPAGMLRHLWELESEQDARIVGMRFVEVGLAESEYNQVGTKWSWSLGIHDSQHDYAITETKRHSDGVHAHEVLLDGYSQSHPDLRTANGGLTKWWSDYLEDDGYIHDNLYRHLEEAGRVAELEALLKKAFWLLRRENDDIEDAGRILKLAGLLKKPFWVLKRHIHELEVDDRKNMMFQDELIRRYLDYLKRI